MLMEPGDELEAHHEAFESAIVVLPMTEMPRQT